MATPVCLQALLDASDVVGLVVQHLTPWQVTALGRTCQAARAALATAFDERPRLLVDVARNHARDGLLKNQVMEWFALTSWEADQLPRTTRPRRGLGGGVYYLYHRDALAQIEARAPSLYNGQAGGTKYTERCVRRNRNRLPDEPRPRPLHLALKRPCESLVRPPPSYYYGRGVPMLDPHYGTARGGFADFYGYHGQVATKRARFGW